MYYLRELNMVCFNLDELTSLFKNDQLKKLKREMLRENILLSELRNDKQKMEKIVDIVVLRNSKNKEIIEIFTALNSTIFYQKDSKICFPLKDSFNIKSNPIKNLDELKDAVQESNLTDFAIYSDDGLRQFQLKQYKEKLDIDSLFNFIEKKLKGYGLNSLNLDNVNLLIALQGDGDSSFKIDFKELSKKISILNLKFKSEILICYNENNKFQVIVQVYPESRICKREIDQNYLADRLM